MENTRVEITFGTATRLARQALGLKVDDYIVKLGNTASRSYITKVELHDEIPSKQMVEKIADVLKMDYGQLIELAKEGKRKQFEKMLSAKYCELILECDEPVKEVL
jgi:transcriptional regulator with XRE-family HTH domain